MKLCNFDIGLDHPFFLIAGPCVIESEQLQMDVAGQLKEMCASLGIPFIFKSSYDKANRSSGSTPRGPGMERGLDILAKVKRELQVPVLTDVHTETEVPAVAAVVDVLQTPAFLCRQTDFIRAVAQSGKPVNIKKGQFLAPWDMKNVIDKARAAAAKRIGNRAEFLRQIEIIHGAGDIEVGIGVEALDKGRSLVAQIAFHLEIGIEPEGLFRAVLQPPPELLGQPRFRQIGDVRRHPGDRQAVFRALAAGIIAALPFGIGHDRLPPHFMKRNVLCGMARGRGDDRPCQ